jgi:hypothetical protein
MTLVSEVTSVVEAFEVSQVKIIWNLFVFNCLGVFVVLLEKLSFLQWLDKIWIIEISEWFSIVLNILLCL